MKFKSLEIYILSRPVLDSAEIERFVRANDLSWLRDPEAQDAESIVEAAGRVCYMSFTDNISKMRYPNSNYINNLIAKGHESVLEHASWTFILDGVSRSFTHQLVRHRVGFSFSQLSQQYHDESEASFVVPHGIEQQTPSFETWKSSVSHALSAYREALEGFASEELSAKERQRFQRSMARSLLPNATATTIAVSANARALRHFFRVRGTIEGDHEMRAVCVELLKQIKPDGPSLFSDLNVVTHDDGAEIIQIG